MKLYPRIVLDLDGVIADFSTTFLKITKGLARKEGWEGADQEYNVSEITGWDFAGIPFFNENRTERVRKALEFFNDVDGWTEIKPYINALKCIQAWAQLGIKIYIATVRPSWPAEQSTQYWLQKHNINHITELLVYKSVGEKIDHLWEMFKSGETYIYLDDKYDTIMSLAHLEVLSHENLIYVRQPYFRDDVHPNSKLAGIYWVYPTWITGSNTIPDAINQRLFT